MGQAIRDNLVYSTGGGSIRATMVARNLSRKNKWREYGQHHESTFVENGAQKRLVFNSKGEVVARHLTVADAVKDGFTTNSGNKLRHEDYQVILDQVTRIKRRELNGIQDLIDAGLTVPADISKQLVGVEDVTDFEDAEQDQNPTDTTNNSLAFGEVYTPNPITHIGCSVPWRQKGFGYLSSIGLQESIRKVAERLEKSLFLGNENIKVPVNGGDPAQLYGYCSHPNRGKATMTDWLDKANADTIYKEVVAHVAEIFENQGGLAENSLCLYFPTNYFRVFGMDYKTEVKGTLLERIMEIPQIKAVKHAEYLPKSELVYVCMDAKTIQLAVSSDIVAIPHTLTGPFESQAMTIMACMNPVIIIDSKKQSGILHVTVEGAG